MRLASLATSCSTSQGDLQQIFVGRGNPSRSLSVLSLSQSVDDTAWAGGSGRPLRHRFDQRRRRCPRWHLPERTRSWRRRRAAPTRALHLPVAAGFPAELPRLPQPLDRRDHSGCPSAAPPSCPRAVCCSCRSPTRGRQPAKAQVTAAAERGGHGGCSMLGATPAGALTDQERPLSHPRGCHALVLRTL